MARLAFLGFATAGAIAATSVSVPADSAPGFRPAPAKPMGMRPAMPSRPMGGKHWGSVPHVPLKPPVSHANSRSYSNSVSNARSRSFSNSYSNSVSNAQISSNAVSQSYNNSNIRVGGFGGGYGGVRPGFVGGFQGYPGGWNGGWQGYPGGWNGGGNWNGRDWGWQDGRWYGVGGWNGGYHRPDRGWRLPSYFVTPRFFVSNWSFYGLSQPGPGFNWVRYYDDAVLIDRRGNIVDSVYGIDWERGADYDRNGQVGDVYDDGYQDGYDDGFDDGMDAADDQVTWGGHWGANAGHSGYSYQAGPGTVVHSGAGGATVVVVQSAPTVTTTTRTETISYAAKPVWKKKVVKWQPKGKTLYRGGAACKCK